MLLYPPVSVRSLWVVVGPVGGTISGLLRILTSASIRCSSAVVRCTMQHWPPEPQPSSTHHCSPTAACATVPPAVAMGAHDSCPHRTRTTPAPGPGLVPGPPCGLSHVYHMPARLPHLSLDSSRTPTASGRYGSPSSSVALHTSWQHVARHPFFMGAAPYKRGVLTYAYCMPIPHAKVASHASCT